MDGRLRTHGSSAHVAFVARQYLVSVAMPRNLFFALSFMHRVDIKPRWFSMKICLKKMAADWRVLSRGTPGTYPLRSG
jgi:hypothetical protein